jgi:hypothetical protein
MALNFNTDVIFSSGQTGGYYEPVSGANKSTVMATIDDLYKMTSWIWGGNTANQLDTKKCLCKSAITSSNYNLIKVASGTESVVTTKNIDLFSFSTPSSSYANNRLIRRDDIKISKIILAVESKTAGLTLNPDPYSLKLFLSNSSDSTTEIKYLCKFSTINNKKNNTVVNYFTLTLPNYLESTTSIFSRDAWVCATLDSTWSYKRWIAMGTNKNYNKKKSTSQVKSITFNLGIKWRDFIRNGCTVHVKIGNAQSDIATWS